MALILATFRGIIFVMLFSLCLDVRFWVQGRNEGEGMYGSAMAILNPPWSLAKQLEEGLPFLVEVLGKSERAGYSVTYQKDG